MTSTLTTVQIRALAALDTYSAWLDAHAAGTQQAWPTTLLPIGFGAERVRRLERDPARRRVVLGRVADWLRSSAAADHPVIAQQHLLPDGTVNIGSLITYAIEAYRLGWR